MELLMLLDEAGPDNIAPEALTYCKLDEIIFKYANEVLMIHERTNHDMRRNAI